MTVLEWIGLFTGIITGIATGITLAYMLISKKIMVSADIGEECREEQQHFSHDTIKIVSEINIVPQNYLDWIEEKEEQDVISQLVEQQRSWITIKRNNG